jgi:hypothetical protein
MALNRELLRISISAIGALLIAGFALNGSAAQTKYPDHPVKVVVEIAKWAKVIKDADVKPAD